MVNIPTIEPASFTAGDTVQWKKSLSDYPASDGWTLKYALRGAGSIDLTASADGDDHLVTVTAAASAAYTAGTYKWMAYVEKSGERYTLAEGYLAINADLVTATSITDRVITLESQIDAINGFFAKNYKYSSYSINGRSLSNYSVDDLFKLRDRLKRELNDLKAADRIARGLGTKKLIRVRFN